MSRDFREQNYYELLEVMPEVSLTELEKAYQRALKFLGTESIATYALFDRNELRLLRKRIEEAFSVLKDPIRRQQYNQKLTESKTEPQDSNAKANTTERPLSAKSYVMVSEETLSHLISNSKQESAIEAKTKAEVKLPATPGSNPQTEKLPNLPAIAPDTEYSGLVLKQQRLAKGLSLEKIAKVTKISVYYLKNIELENYSMLPAAVYVKLYLRQICKLLGLDPDSASKSYCERMAKSGKQ